MQEETGLEYQVKAWELIQPIPDSAATVGHSQHFTRTYRTRKAESKSRKAEAEK